MTSGGGCQMAGEQGAGRTGGLQLPATAAPAESRFARHAGFSNSRNASFRPTLLPCAGGHHPQLWRALPLLRSFASETPVTHHSVQLSCVQVVIIPSFGERYLSSALFQTLREEAEAQTFEA